MRCPLLMSACLITETPYDRIAQECPKEECAWWMAPFKECAICSIAGDLWAITGELSDIEEKMPHAGQFLK